MLDTDTMRPAVEALLDRWDIPKHMKPISAEKLQQMMRESGTKPEDNALSRAIVEMREE